MMQIDYTVTLMDYLTAVKAVQTRLLRHSSKDGCYILLLTLSLLSLVASVVYRSLFSFRYHGKYLYLLSRSEYVFLAFIILFLIANRVRIARYYKCMFLKEGAVLGQHRIVLEEAGFRCSGRYGESFLTWEGIQSLEECKGVILIYIDKGVFYCVPARTFRSESEKAEFISTIQSHLVPVHSTSPIKSANKETGQPHGALQPPATARQNLYQYRSLSRDLLLNILAGLRLAVFQKVSISDFRVSVGQLIALAVFELVVVFGLNFSIVRTEGYLDYRNLPNMLFYVPLMLTAAYFIAKSESNRELLIAIPIALVSVSFPVEAAGFLLQIAVGDKGEQFSSTLMPESHHYVILGWWMVAAYVGLVRLTGPSRKYRVGLILLSLLAIPLWYIPRGGLWTAKYDDNYLPEQSRYAIVSEEAFYSQPALLEQKLEGLKPDREGMVDLYFAGLACYSTQDVFMKEVDVIRQLFDERFDTAGRSIILINNPKTVKDTPIASLTSLDRTLRHIGKIINPEEDILFLYLTSHGSKKYELSVEYWPLELNDIDPESLKKAVAESGIKWKIIVISACYSGAYIEFLKDDNAIILTAADASSNSFGCGDESDFTFFGKAYYEELRQNFSFVRAFEKAKEVIAKQEQVHSYSPSNPQIHVGSAILEKLDKLEARLKSGTVENAKKGYRSVAEKRN